MKKNYQVIVRGGVAIDSFKATPEQAKAYWSLMYDTEFTKYEEVQLDPVMENITIEHDYPYLFIHKDGEHIILAEYNEDTQVFAQCDKDIGSKLSDEDITEHLLQFPGVKDLCLCPQCNGEGGYFVEEGPYGYAKECECEGVIFELDHLIPVRK